MLRQKRNLSAFRQYQEHVASILEEENEISECSDSENDENRSASNITGNILAINFTELNASKENTTSHNSFYTPSAKRVKRSPLSAVRQKPLHIKRTKRTLLQGSTTLFRDLNLSIRNSNTFDCLKSQDEDESQELTIEWSSSDESDNVSVQKSITVDTQSTQKSIPPSWECTQNNKNNEPKKNMYKRCRRGGYLHQLQQTTEHSKTEKKFLKHDKKFGIRHYVSLRVLKIENSFGVNLATVISPSSEISHIVLNADIAQRITTDCIIDSFVEEDEPYEIEHCDEIKRIIVQPGKIMIS